MFNNAAVVDYVIIKHHYASEITENKCIFTRTLISVYDFNT